MSKATTPLAIPQATDTKDPVPGLVAQVYAESPAAVRSRLLEQLLQPLSLLSLSAVAGGIFARLTLGNGWPRLRVSADDVNRVDPSDVVALVNYVQQVSVHAVDGLTRIIASVPVLTGSAAAAMLITVLSARALNHPPTISGDPDLHA